MKIVIFGGTFNPIHNGHVRVVSYIHDKLKPDRLILMPDHIPPHKPADSLLPDIHRLNMCRLAVSEIPGVEVSDYEMGIEGKSYTVNTLEHFKSLYPSDELYFVVGSDMLKSFPRWYRSDRISELATLLCFSRTGDDGEELEKSAQRVKDELGTRCILLGCEPAQVSSTAVRAMLYAKSNSGGMIPVKVEEYIHKNNLYNFDKSRYNRYVQYLRENLSEKRFTHSMNVADEALLLAGLNDCDLDKAYFAGLVHDICKEIPFDKQLELVKRSEFPVDTVELNAPKTYHGIAGAVYLKESFGVTDTEVLSAVRYHTVAKGGMTTLEKIVYIADLISAEREYPGVDEMRECARRDLNLGMYEAMKFSVSYSCAHVRTIPACTLAAYNEYTSYRLSLEKSDK